MTNVGIVIPTFRRPEPLDRCLSGIRAMSRQPSEVLTVLRLDDFDGRAVAQKWGVRIVDVTEPGHLPPIRVGLQECRAEVMAVLDDDAVPRPDWLARIEPHFRLKETVCVTGAVCQHMPEDGPRMQRNWGASATRALVRRKGRTWYAGLASLPSDTDCANAGLVHPVEVSHLQGGNCAYLCSALRRTGIDMSLNRGAAIGYEADLALGLRRCGRVLFDPLLVVDHYLAVRQGAPGRNDRLASIEDYSYNLFFLQSKHFTTAERIRFNVYMAIVGQRLSPGLARAREVARLEGESALHVLSVTASARRTGSRLGRERRGSHNGGPSIRSQSHEANGPRDARS